MILCPEIEPLAGRQADLLPRFHLGNGRGDRAAAQGLVQHLQGVRRPTHPHQGQPRRIQPQGCQTRAIEAAPLPLRPGGLDDQAPPLPATGQGASHQHEGKAHGRCRCRPVDGGRLVQAEGQPRPMEATVDLSQTQGHPRGALHRHLSRGPPVSPQASRCAHPRPRRRAPGPFKRADLAAQPVQRVFRQAPVIHVAPTMFLFCSPINLRHSGESSRCDGSV